MSNGSPKRGAGRAPLRRGYWRVVGALWLGCAVGGCAATSPAPDPVPAPLVRTGGSTFRPAASRSVPAPVLSGQASYYAHKYHGRTTASGERFNMHAMTAAHRTLPFGSVVRVTNPANGRQVTVRINDRGPFIDGRIIDLSLATAQRLDMVKAGVIPVQVEVLASVSDASR